jgi:hypothetical protein
MFDCVFHNKFKRWIPIRLVEGTNHTNKVVQLKNWLFDRESNY